MPRSRSSHFFGAASLTLIALLFWSTKARAASQVSLKGVLLTPKQATASKLKSLAKEGFDAVVLYLEDAASEEENEAAAERVKNAKLALHYWIEIGRSPTLADAQPEWMASLQTHDEWRRHFPAFPKPAANQVVKNYPWVPLLYEETFPVHLQRVEALIDGLPTAQRIFLNDLQGAPSACGCGNHFCRWTADYGPITTAKRLPDDAAAKFLAAVEKMMPGAKVIPVWTTECAEHDKQSGCGGVACFGGACWREYNAQLQPVAKQAENIAVLLPLRDFPTGSTGVRQTGEWQATALKSFTEVLPKREGAVIPPSRLISVLQGWDVTPTERSAQIEHNLAAGVGGYIVALTKIEQSWEPRLFTLRTKGGN
jgi:hypothetical protein